MLSEYEERLELKRQEVSRLQQQRDKLLATQRKLQELQQNVSTVSESPLCAYSRNRTYGTYVHIVHACMYEIFGPRDS